MRNNDRVYDVFSFFCCFLLSTDGEERKFALLLLPLLPYCS
jgi:hypothetical protein